MHRSSASTSQSWMATVGRRWMFGFCLSLALGRTERGLFESEYGEDLGEIFE